MSVSELNLFMPKTAEASFSVPYLNFHHIHKDLTLHSYHTSIVVSSSILRDMKTYREKRSFRYAFYVLNFENNTNWQMIVISVRVAAFVLLEHNSFSCFLVLLGQILKVMNFFLPHLVSKIWHRKKRRFLCVFWISCVHRTASAKLLFADCHHVCFEIALRKEAKESAYFAEQCLKSRHISSNRFFLFGNIGFWLLLRRRLLHIGTTRQIV